MNPPENRHTPRAAWIVGVILVTVSVSGFFMGLRQTGSQISLTRPVSLVPPEPDGPPVRRSGSVPVAPSYARQDWLRDGPNAEWTNRIASLAQPAVRPAPPANPTPAEREDARADRATRRAFDGAPPMAPHPLDTLSSAACLACHGPGLAVRDRVASRLSHDRYVSCTQCHASNIAATPPTTLPALHAPVSENAFTPAPAHIPRLRAWAQAPPTIPHGTFMRNECLSCHGPLGFTGLRTPHPERQSCTQCHVPDASVDQRVFSTAADSAPPRGFPAASP